VSAVTGATDGRRSWWLAIVLSVAALIVAGTVVGLRLLSGPASGPGPDGDGRPPTAQRPDPSRTTEAAASPTPAASTAPGVPPSTTAPALTDRQLAGQRVIYSYRGLTPPAILLTHIRKGEAAGVIFFGENISSTTQIAGVVSQLREVQRSSPVHAPLLLMTDQEGGKVRRLPGQPVESAQQIGQSANPAAAATKAGTGAAATLIAAGMNVNLAPVLDVYYAAGNFIDQYQRSYSSDAHTVATLGTDFLTAQQKAGAAATAKHFPGLGSAERGQNTDTGAVTLTVNLSGLRSRDELPYSAAIAAGVKLVMLSWAVYPALDATRPAGLSPVVVGSELRGRLHFHGVTITDALEANSLRVYGTTSQRALLAAQAGMDLILCAARDVGQGESATVALADELTAGRLDRGTFQDAVDRVTTLRASLH
jgi:beta-N-acetylhexosaminidase